MKTVLKILLPMGAVWIAGCGGATPESTTPASNPPSTASSPAPSSQPQLAAATTSSGGAPATFAEQVELGQKVYGEHCASCHGASGSGGKAPALVGLSKGALPLNPPATAKYRKTQFKTVADIANFVTKTMPPTAPGSLTAEQYWATLAFDLKANGINLDKKLDATVAQSLTVPR
jgi:S-disulfanyl-L-cysteine oxidoreductase SoxD